MLAVFKNFLKYSFLLEQLVKRELTIKYKRSFLGVLWSVLNPLLMMLILNVVFSHLFRGQIENYLVYYLSGSVLFTFMSEVTGGALFSILGNSGLVSKVYIPKYILPLSKTISSLVNTGFSLVALFIVVVATGVPLNWPMLLFPIVFFFLFFFVLGLALLFGALTVFFRDLIHLHGILMMVWMYITPIFYPESVLKNAFPLLLDLNPMYPFVRFMRDILLYNRVPDWGTVGLCALFAAISIVVGLVVFRRSQDRFMLYL